MALVILLITAAIWWGTVAAPFHYDDQRTVQHNLEIRHPGNIPAFVADFFRRGGLKIGYALNYSLGGKEADGAPAARSFHVVNVALHSINAVLAFGLTLTVLRRSPNQAARQHHLPLAAAVALLFALHPIQGMAVSLVASRAVLQAGTFSLLGLLLLLGALSGQRSPGTRYALLAGAVVAFLCALGSKSVAVGTLGLGLLLAWTLAPQELSPRARRIMAGAALLALVIGSVIVVALGGEVWQSSDHGPALNLLTQTGVVTRYLGLLFWPARLSVEHDIALVGSPWAWSALGPALLMVALLALGAVLVWRRRLMGLCVGWFLVALAPSSSIVPRAEQMVEYRTYLAVLGFAGAGLWLICQTARLLSGWSTAHGKTRTALAGGLCVLLLCLLSARTLGRQRVYADPIALWADAATKAPHRARPAFNLGASLALAGRDAEALPHLQRAASLQPDRPDVHLMLGRAYAALNRPEEATDHLQQAQRLMESLPPAEAPSYEMILPALAHEQWQLGNRFAAAGRYQRAVELYRGAIRAGPGRAEAYYNLGVVRESLGQFDAAVEVWRSGLQRAPDDVGMMVELTWQLAACPDHSLRDGAEAVRLAERAVRLTEPATAELLDLLAASYAQAGRFDRAAETASEACRKAEADGRGELARSIQARLQLYAARETLGEPP